MSVIRFTRWMSNKKAKFYVALTLMGMWAQESFAQSRLSSISSTLKTEIESIKGPAMIISGVVGLVLTIIGIIEFKNLGDPAMRQQASVGKAVMNLLVGVALLTLTWWIGSAATTVGSGTNYTIQLN